MVAINSNTFLITLQRDFDFTGEYDLQNFPLKDFNYFSAFSSTPVILEVPFAPLHYIIDKSNLQLPEKELRLITTAENEGIYYKLNNTEAFKGQIRVFIDGTGVVPSDFYNTPISVLFTFYKTPPNQLNRKTKDLFWGSFNLDGSEQSFELNPPINCSGLCQLFTPITDYIFECNIIEKNYVYDYQTDSEYYGPYIKTNSNFLEFSKCATKINRITIAAFIPGSNNPLGVDEAFATNTIPFCFMFF